MCGRYVRKSTRREVAAWFGIAPGMDHDRNVWGASYNIAPQSFQPVIRLNRDTATREIVLMRWGPGALLVKRRQDRLQHHQCACGNRGHRARFSRGGQTPPLPGAGRCVL